MKKKEITTDVTTLREKLWQTKRDLAAGKLKNIREIRSIKADIARSLTMTNAQKVTK